MFYIVYSWDEYLPQFHFCRSLTDKFVYDIFYCIVFHNLGQHRFYSCSMNLAPDSNESYI